MLGLSQDWKNTKMGAHKRPRITSKVSGEGREGRVGKTEIMIIVYKGSALQSSVFLAAALNLPHQLHHCALEP